MYFAFFFNLLVLPVLLLFPVIIYLQLCLRYSAH